MRIKTKYKITNSYLVCIKCSLETESQLICLLKNFVLMSEKKFEKAKSSAPYKVH